MSAYWQHTRSKEALLAGMTQNRKLRGEKKPECTVW